MYGPLSSTRRSLSRARNKMWLTGLINIGLWVWLPKKETYASIRHPLIKIMTYRPLHEFLMFLWVIPSPPTLPISEKPWFSFYHYRLYIISRPSVQFFYPNIMTSLGWLGWGWQRLWWRDRYFNIQHYINLKCST